MRSSLASCPCASSRSMTGPRIVARKIAICSARSLGFRSFGSISEVLLAPFRRGTLVADRLPSRERSIQVGAGFGLISALTLTPRAQRRGTRAARAAGAASWDPSSPRAPSPLLHGLRPASQRHPARHRVEAERRRGADPKPHRERRCLHEPPERERESDRRRAVLPSRQHLPRDDKEHGAAGHAPVTPPRDHDDRGILAGARGAAHLPLTDAVTVELDPAPDRAARGLAAQAYRRPGLGDGRRSRDPALEIDRALDHTAVASIPQHPNRSTTRRAVRLDMTSSSPMGPASRRCSVLRARRTAYGSAPERARRSTRRRHAARPQVAHRTAQVFSLPPGPPSDHLKPIELLLPAATPLRRR